MRILVAVAIAALAAGPALAQSPPGLVSTAQALNPAAQPQYEEIIAQQELARQQAIAQQNQLMSLEGRMRTQAALQAAPGLRLPDHIVPPEIGRGAPPPNIDVSQLPSIPDSELADSNRRVLEASKPAR